jgi:hypothetical protein
MFSLPIGSLTGVKALSSRGSRAGSSSAGTPAWGPKAEDEPEKSLSITHPSRGRYSSNVVVRPRAGGEYKKKTVRHTKSGTLDTQKVACKLEEGMKAVPTI